MSPGELLRRLGALLRRRGEDADMDAELEAHLDLSEADHRRQGMTAAAARRRALVALGGLEQAREGQRAARGFPWLGAALRDAAYALRGLRREPGFALAAVLTLALAIGANVAVFSVVDAILLRPLPFPQPQRLLWMAPKPSPCSLSCETYTADAYEEFVAQNRSFTSVAGYSPFTSAENLRLTGRGEPQPVTGVGVTVNFFQSLGVSPVLGRQFEARDAATGAAPVALISYAYWRRQLNANPAVVGRALDINGAPLTVVGVLPANFDFGAVFWPGVNVQMFVPLVLDDIRNQGNTLLLLGRLRDGVTLAQAQAESDSILPRLYFRSTIPASYGFYRRRLMRLETLKEYVSGRLRRSLILLWCAVGAILLIACVNLANLMLARTAARRKEFALRAALGASRARLFRQWLTESAVLAAAGAAAGLGLAAAMVAFLARRGSLALPLLGEVRLDGGAVFWTLAVAAAAMLLFGVAPALKAASVDPQPALQEAGPSFSDGPSHQRLRSTLVIAEVAMAAMLLVAAGLLLRSFLRVLDLDLGFVPSHAAAIKVDYDTNADGAHRYAFFEQMIERVQAVPGIEAAGVADYLPLGRNRSWGPVGVKGVQYRPGQLPSPFVYMVTPGYFRAMGMRLRGRDFAWSDGANSPPVIVLNYTAAHALWPNDDGIGRIATINGVDRRLIGVLDDVRAANVEGQAGWQVYFSLAQEGPNGAQLVVRSHLPPEALALEVMAALRTVNPNQPAAALRPVAAIVDAAESPRRFFALLVAAFAVFGIALAGLGIYGVIAYGVTRRRQEIAIRMALGASRARVQLGVMAGALRLALVGLVLGTVASLLMARALAALLFGIAPGDPATFAAMVALLVAAAAVAAYLPARRAARIPPMAALRGD